MASQDRQDPGGDRLTSGPSPGEPRRTPRCPLCGAANGCAVAEAGRFDVACWCRDVHFTPELITRVPESQRGEACICRACAAAAREA